MLTKLMTANDVADLLGLSKSFIYTLVRTGQLRAIKFGSSVRFSEDDLKVYIQLNAVNGSTAAQCLFPQP